MGIAGRQCGGCGLLKECLTSTRKKTASPGGTVAVSRV